MGINKIELPAVVVEELYHSSLIESNLNLNNRKSAVIAPITDKESKAEYNTPREWKSLGKNDKNILIVLKSEEFVHLPDNELAFLTGILSACNLSLADVAIVNINNYPDTKYKELISFYSSKVVLLFGFEPPDFGLPMNFPHYQIQGFANNSFLYAPSLKNLEKDKIEKSKLWVSLKRLFNL